MECYFFISSMKPLAMNTTMIRTMTATLTIIVSALEDCLGVEHFG